jgi:tetratricopeptide (TPR) repeat protein
MRTRISAGALALCLSLAPVSTLHAADPGPSSPTSAPSSAPASKPSVAVDELAKSRSLIAAKNYSQALVELKKVDRVMANNADVKNLLGFTSRKLGQYSQAGGYYAKALQIDPKHLGALEYQGELFILQKKVALAKRNLATLKRLCGTSCEEYEDLADAITASAKKG